MPATGTKRGRKPKPPANRRTLLFQLRVSPLEKAQIETDAAEVGLKTSVLARRRLLNRAPVETPAAVTQPVPAEASPDLEERIRILARGKFSYLPTATALRMARKQVEEERAAG